MSWDRLGNLSFVLSSDGEEGLSSIVMDKEKVVLYQVTDTVESVSSSMPRPKINQLTKRCLKSRLPFFCLFWKHFYIIILDIFRYPSVWFLF